MKKGHTQKESGQVSLDVFTCSEKILHHVHTCRENVQNDAPNKKGGMVKTFIQRMRERESKCVGFKDMYGQRKRTSKGRHRQKDLHVQMKLKGYLIRRTYIFNKKIPYTLY